MRSVLIHLSWKAGANVSKPFTLYHPDVCFITLSVYVWLFHKGIVEKEYCLWSCPSLKLMFKFEPFIHKCFSIRVMELWAGRCRYSRVKCLVSWWSCQSRTQSIPCGAWTYATSSVKSSTAVVSYTSECRVQTNKGFHTRLALTVYWPLCRGHTGSLSLSKGSNQNKSVQIIPLSWKPSTVSESIPPYFWIHRILLGGCTITMIIQSPVYSSCFIQRHSDKRPLFITIMPVALSSQMHSQKSSLTVRRLKDRKALMRWVYIRQES